MKAIKNLVSRQVAALIELQLLIGARPSELLKLRPQDFDTSGEVWMATLVRHKTVNQGRGRTLYFGPRAQAVLKPFLLRKPESYLFSPCEAEAERLVALHETRLTPAGQGNGPATNRVRRPKVKPGEFYTAASYRRAIDRACKNAGIEPWHPYQLRHNAATRFRKQYGLDAAQVLLGHSEVT